MFRHIYSKKKREEERRRKEREEIRRDEKRKETKITVECVVMCIGYAKWGRQGEWKRHGT